MKTTMKFFAQILMILTLTFTSCSKDGDEGPTGPAGIDGIDGLDGVNGADGADGVDGTDGNANVETTVFLNPTWSPAGLMTLQAPNITQDAFDYYLILGYLKEGDVWYSSNGNQAVGGYYRGSYDIGRYFVRAFDFNDVIDQTPPNVSQAKVIVIEPSNVILKSGNGKNIQALLNFKKEMLDDLFDAGVDITDYEAICKHFNINI